MPSLKAFFDSASSRCKTGKKYCAYLGFFHFLGAGKVRNIIKKLSRVFRCCLLQTFFCVSLFNCLTGVFICSPQRCQNWLGNHHAWFNSCEFFIRQNLFGQKMLSRYVSHVSSKKLCSLRDQKLRGQNK